ncbi:MAG: sensor histidine kinase [Burkholderiales bacterium]
MAPDEPRHLSTPTAAPDLAERIAAPGWLPRFLRETTPGRRTLFGEILDWLLVPLMLLLPVSVVLTYISATALSDPPYDRALGESVQVLAEQLKVRGGNLTADLPVSAREILRADELDAVYFQVLGTRGEFIAGDRDLPLPDEDEIVPPNEVRFRYAKFNGVDVRVAWMVAVPPGLQRDSTKAQLSYPLVQVAETLNKRAQLANEIVKGVILPQFLVLPLAVTLVWFGLVRGMIPLSRLSSRIRRRQPGDLSPIDPGDVPEEVAPLIASINDLMQRLDASLTGQQRFIANAAHQLRTPLAGLKTQAELAERLIHAGADRSELARSLTQITRSTERAARMVNQLLALTRAERDRDGDPMPAAQPVALDLLVRERVADFTHAALAKRVDLGCDEARASQLYVTGDLLLLGELVGNLIDNAVRYTPTGGIINVHARPAPPDGVLLEVEDTGPGIPPHERELVFERFYRVLSSDPEARNLDGSGLGLAIVREIATRHGARVSIRDNPSGGSVFSVLFPAAPAPVETGSR